MHQDPARRLPARRLPASPFRATGPFRNEPMTYCAGILVSQGLVMIADTRTNAGLDNISTYRKLHVVAEPGERVLAIATAGNLSVSQSVISLLNEGLENPQSGETETIRQVPTMFRAAQLIGRAIRHVRATDEEALEEAKLSFEVSMLFGGQIRGGPMRLYMIYSAGNFIECGREAPFLQIGEHKYGKPILDRAVKFETEIYDALKIGLISMDSTMRSNLGVGLPIDIAVICRDSLEAELVHRIEAGEPYFRDLRERWSAALSAAHKAIPRPPYGTSAASPDPGL
jgi:putative proteasome-type protease